jgi:hypothetical protein
MKVPPTNAAANSTPGTVGHSTLAATPMASTTQAMLKDRETPRREAAHPQRATEGTAVRPATSHTSGSAVRMSGEPRTIATRKVAVTI